MAAVQSPLSPSVADRLRQARIELLFGQMPQGLAATLVNGLALALVQCSVIDPVITWVWFGVMLSVTLARAALYVSFRRATLTASNWRVWHVRFSVSAGLSAAVFGAGGYMLFPLHSPVHQAFIGFVLAGMSAGAVGAFAGCFKTFSTYIVMSVLPFTILLLSQGETVQLAMGVMCVAFMVATLMTSKKTAAVTLEAWRLRFENLDLVDDLKQSTDRLLATNLQMQFEISQRQIALQALSLAKQAAEEATLAKSNFLANMSHEIRTPMNGVFGMTDLLNRTALDDRQRRLVATISDSAKTLLAIINDILDISRIESGKFTLDSFDFDPRHCVERAVEMFATEADRKGLELALYIADDLPGMVRGDAGRLRQVCVNLVGNAVKFTEQGEVAIRVTRAADEEGGQRIAVEITDTGVGIEPETIEKLFHPFVQAETSITRRFGGTGLGLAISQHLVGLMNGRIGMESEPGKGTVVRFSVSLEAAVIERPRAASDRGSLRGARALVLDDRNANREIVANYLEGCGVSVTGTALPSLAWTQLITAAAESRPFDMLIVDMLMPEENGVEFARRVKADPALSGTGIILATSIAWNGDLKAVREAGISALLTKPIRRHDLLDEAANLLRPIMPRERAQAEPTWVDRRQFKARILLAEDNRVNIAVAEEYLAEFGCVVTVVNDGAAAVEASAAQSFDVILMDCQMPVMDGLTATRGIRNREALAEASARVPIIALTAHAFEENQRRCIAAGMDDYLCKPYSDRQLHEMLAKWLDMACQGRSAGADSVAAPDVAPAEPAGSASQTPRAAKSDVLLSARGHTDAPPPGMDMSAVSALRTARPDLYQRLVTAYLDFAPATIGQLRQAFETANIHALRMAAHSLKSSSANLGAQRLSDLYRALESTSETGDLTDLVKRVEESEQEFARVRTYLAAQTSGGSPRTRRPLKSA